MKNIIYKFSDRFILTSQMTKRIENRIALLYPATKISLINKTADYLIRIYILMGVATILLSIFAEFSLYYSLVVFLVLYALVSSRIYTELDKLELKLLYDLQKFLEDVKYRFRFDGMLEEALQEAINMADYNMAIHGELIYRSLKEEYISNSVDYEDVAPNSFFKTFYMMCKNVTVYGDKKVGGESYFIKNVSYLKDDIGVDILKRRRINNVFMGLLGITIIPVFAIKPIEKWSVSNIPELADTYEGMFGILSTILMGVLSFVIYRIILKLKYPYVKNEEKAEWVEGLSKMTVMKKAAISIIKMNYRKSFEFERRLKDIGYSYDIIEFYIKRIVMTLITFIISMIICISISASLSLNIVNIWTFIVSLLSAIVMYGYQYFEVVMKEGLMLMNREDELVRFQTIILMLKETDRISVADILSQMEKFSYSFKSVLEELIYLFPYKGKRVFEEIKGRSGFLGFDRLMDSFRACDYMSISKAFSDVEKERAYYVMKHKQDNDFMIEERSMIAKVISFIPICAVIITKLIIPFVVEGIGQINIF